MVLPVHSAAIDYISGRADSLCFVFAGSAWLLSFRARSSVRRQSQVCLLLRRGAKCGLLSLCSRETGLLWVALFILHCCLFDLGLTKRGKILLVVGCLLVLASYGGCVTCPAGGPSMWR